MSFSFKPLSEEEVIGLLKPGEYAFQVKNAEDAVSKAGNAMIRLTLAVWDDQGKERIITDYLLAALMYKVKHFCDAVGLEDKYQQGKFEAIDCVGKSGRCKIKIDEQDGYAPKNSVQDYIKNKVTKLESKKEEQKDTNGFVDDDIPF